MAMSSPVFDPQAPNRDRVVVVVIGQTHPVSNERFELFLAQVNRPLVDQHSGQASRFQQYRDAARSSLGIKRRNGRRHDFP